MLSMIAQILSKSHKQRLRLHLPPPQNSARHKKYQQSQSSQDSDDYAQVYRKWVDKLVARGEYSKIKSYDEWYAIASEVM